MIEVGHTIENRFVVDRLLGEGAMAQILAVRNPAGQQFALKVALAADPAMHARLKNEARAQAGLRHPNVLAVTEKLEIDGHPAILLDYIDGPDLREVLKAVVPSIEDALTVFRAICAGVGAAHDLGLVHRDLKPSNILLARSAHGAVTPKVADFGLVKLAPGERRLTLKGATMGTPAYMSPEQIRDSGNVDRRTDIWALGCLLYELTTGKSPFMGNGILGVFEAIAAGDYPHPEHETGPLPSAIHAAIEGCLKVEVTHRIADCATLLAFLDGDEPTVTSHALGGLPPADPMPHVAGTLPASSRFAQQVARYHAADATTDDAATIYTQASLLSLEPEVPLVTTETPTASEVPQEPQRRVSLAWVMAGVLLLAGGAGWLIGWLAA